MRDRVDRSLEHVFTILALHLEREALRTRVPRPAYQDSRYRGTALEYLDTVLPREIRDDVWPFLGPEAALPTIRNPQEILAELTRVVAGVGPLVDEDVVT